MYHCRQDLDKKTQEHQGRAYILGMYIHNRGHLHKGSNYIILGFDLASVKSDRLRA